MRKDFYVRISGENVYTTRPTPPHYYDAWSCSPSILLPINPSPPSACMFELFDEWFKTTWNTKYFESADTAPNWHSLISGKLNSNRAIIGTLILDELIVLLLWLLLSKLYNKLELYNKLKSYQCSVCHNSSNSISAFDTAKHTLCVFAHCSRDLLWAINDKYAVFVAESPIIPRLTLFFILSIAPIILSFTRLTPFSWGDVRPDSCRAWLVPWRRTVCWRWQIRYCTCAIRA